VTPISQPPKLYLASANLGKLREFREGARPAGLGVEAVHGIASLPVCVEDAATFEENARKKALHYSAYQEGLVFADDSGICAVALGGQPGVRSARFAGPQATDAANNAKLLEEMRRTGSHDWSAHYVCVIVLAERGQVLNVTEGRADGILLPNPRGSGGFGYDPYFFYPPMNKTFAELPSDAKFAVSHRGKAFRKLLHYLQAWPPKPTAR
jgi:XTP/dITP diphosphohydrolase